MGRLTSNGWILVDPSRTATPSGYNIAWGMESNNTFGARTTVGYRLVLSGIGFTPNSNVKITLESVSGGAPSSGEFVWNVTSDNIGDVQETVSPSALWNTKGQLVRNNYFYSIARQSGDAGALGTYSVGQLLSSDTTFSPLPPSSEFVVERKVQGDENVVFGWYDNVVGEEKILASANLVTPFVFRIEDLVAGFNYLVTLDVSWTIAHVLVGTPVGASTVDEDIVDIPLNINEMAGQTFSPTRAQVVSETVDVPYTLTTERDVVMCDYRQTQNDVIQSGAREVTVPLTAEGDKFVVTTRSGSLIPIDTITDNGDGTTTITTLQDMAGDFFVGLEYEMRYKLGNLEVKSANRDGQSTSTKFATKDRLSTMTLAYTDSRVFNVEIDAPKRPTRVVEFIHPRRGYNDIGESGIGDGYFRFHVRGKTRDTEVTVVDSSVFPISLQHVEIERKVDARSR